jgi:hypothetical protein
MGINVGIKVGHIITNREVLENQTGQQLYRIFAQCTVPDVSAAYFKY